jgi:hypothetical protein
MSIKRVARVAVAIFVTIFAAMTAYKRVSAAPDTTWKDLSPRTLTFLKTTYTAKTPGVIQLITIQLKADGSVNKETRLLSQSRAPGELVPTINNIFDRKAGTNAIIASGPGFGVKSTIALHPPDLAAEMLARNGRCGTDTEPKVFMGIEAFPSVTSHESPTSNAHNWVTTEWLAPELNCMAVYLTTECLRKDDDGSANPAYSFWDGPELVVERRLIAVKNSISDSAFSDFTGYLEGPPSEIHRRIWVNNPVRQQAVDAEFAEQDQAYFAHRPR